MLSRGTIQYIYDTLREVLAIYQDDLYDDPLEDVREELEEIVKLLEALL